METLSDLFSLQASTCIIYKCTYGSRAFGLATENSDVDIRGVFVLPKRQFYGLDQLQQLSDERSNEVYWELSRFVELLLKNNPNALETLAISEQFILMKDPLFSKLTVEMFLSAQCYETFVKYADTQLKKARGLNKKIVQPVAKQRKAVLDFCYVLEGYNSMLLSEWLLARKIQQARCGLVRIPHVRDSYALFVGEEGEYAGIVKGDASDDVHTSSIPAGRSPIATMTFNKDAYRRSCKAHQEYWAWVEQRNEDRYNTNVEAGQGFDTKNMMHVFRLIGMAEDIVRKRQIITLRPEREALMKIKRGERPYADLLVEAENRLAKLADEFKHSDLPAKPDREGALNALFCIRDGIYAREVCV